MRLSGQLHTAMYHKQCCCVEIIAKLQPAGNDRAGLWHVAALGNYRSVVEAPYLEIWPAERHNDAS